jgi:hypothetical protein
MNHFYTEQLETRRRCESLRFCLTNITKWEYVIVEIMNSMYRLTKLYNYQCIVPICLAISIETFERRRILRGLIRTVIHAVILFKQL